MNRPEPTLDDVANAEKSAPDTAQPEATIAPVTDNPPSPLARTIDLEGRPVPKDEPTEYTVDMPGAAPASPVLPPTDAETTFADDAALRAEFVRTGDWSTEDGTQTIDVGEPDVDDQQDDRTGAWETDDEDTRRLPRRGATHGTPEDRTGAWDLEIEGTQRLGGGGPTVGKPDKDDRTDVFNTEEGIQALDKTRLAGTMDQAPAEQPPPAVAPTKKRRRERTPPPRRVAGYEVISELGRGGMGVVYKARQPGANRLVAIKMVLAGSHASKDQMTRFRMEAEAVANLQHPNIVQLYEVGEENGCPFFSLEFVEGSPLDKKIDSTPQPPRDAARLTRKIAEAMALAHSRGIIHRDLKPANILINKEGEPKVTDFGLAKRFEDASDGPTRDGAIMGTPSYMAPEQAQGRTKHTGPAADIYSLGSILYDLLTGRPPFRGTTLLETLQQVQTMEPLPPGRLQPTLPGDLQTICLKALQKEPAKRYQSMAALAEDLRRFLDGEPILARPTPWYERTGKWIKRKPAQASLIGVCTLGIVLFLLLGGLWLDSERRSAEAREQEAKDQEQKQRQIAKLEAVAAAEAKKREEQQRALAALEAASAAEAKKQAERERALRELADKNYKRARSAVDHMLTRVGARTLAHIPQMEKVRRELLAEARALYEEFAQERPGDVDSRIESALARKRLGDIEDMLGQPRQAEKSYLAALEMLGKLSVENPGRTDLKRDLAASSMNLGLLLQDQKRLLEAEKFFRAALAERRALHEAELKDDVLTAELAQAHLNLGVVLLVQSRHKPAEEELTAGRNLLDDLAKRLPTRTVRVDLARVRFNLARLHEAGEIATAVTHYTAAGAILAELSKEDPGNPEYRFEVARVEHQLGDLYRDGQPKLALPHYEAALGFFERLVRDFSAVPIYRQAFARTHDHVAILHLAAGAADKAKTAADEALAVRKQAVVDFPDLPDVHRALASSYVNWGVQLLLASRFKDAEAALLEAKDQLESLVGKHREDPEFAKELAGVHHNLATLWQQQSRSGDAKDACERSLAIWLDLSKRHPDVPDYSKEVAQSRINLGSFLLILGKKEAAEEPYRLAVNDLKIATRGHPELVDHRHLLAIGLTNLGNLLNDQKKPLEAEAAWKEAQEEYVALIKVDPDRLTFQQELGRAFDAYAVFLAGGKRFEEARKSWGQAVALQQALADKHPMHPDYRRELAISHNNLGVLAALEMNTGGAEKEYRLALAILEEFEPKLPANAAYLTEIIKTHRNLAALAPPDKVTAHPSWYRMMEVQEKRALAFPTVLAYRAEVVNTLSELGERFLVNEKYAEAETMYGKAVEHLRHLSKDPAFKEQVLQGTYLLRLKAAQAALGREDHALATRILDEIGRPDRPKLKQEPLAASLMARAAGLVAKDSALNDAEKKTLRERHGSQAVKMLQEARMLGLLDAAFLRGPDFDPIRDRADFQALATSLKKD